MAISTYTVGPGTLKFTLAGASKSETPFESQVTKCVINTSADRGDQLNVLSGESIGSEPDYKAQLEVSVLQDLKKNGIVDWSWTNMGKEATFTYTPNTAEAATVTGKCTIDPISIGGEVKSRATSDFTWDCIGMPTFTPKG